jgi:hypothetical protein
LLFIIPIIVSSQTWDYPVKPGTESWKKLQSNQEMVEICQIPEKILKSISTEELFEICLEYPLIYDVFAFEDLNKGMSKLFVDFNGIRELYRRSGLSKKLMKRYNQKIQSLSFLNESHTDFMKGQFIVLVSLLELFMYRANLADSNIENTKAIMQCLVSGYENKSKYANYFRGIGFRSNFYSRSHILF